MVKVDFATGRGLSNLGRYQLVRKEFLENDPGLHKYVLDHADTFDCYMIGILSAICTDEQWNDALNSAIRMMDEYIQQKEVSTLPDDKTTLDETEPKSEESDEDEESEDSDKEDDE